MRTPQNCPEVIADVIVRCWNADPNERPSFNVIFTDINGLYQQHFQPENSKKDQTIIPDSENAYLTTHLKNSSDVQNIYNTQ